MSKFGSKEDLLKAIETQFTQMQSGRLSMEDLELLVEQSRELYERTLILRYKAYEEKVFGEVKQVLEPVVEEKQEEVQPAPIFEAEVKLETVLSPDVPAAEPIFDFDLFDEKPEVTEPNAANEAEVPAEEVVEELELTIVEEEIQIEVAEEANEEPIAEEAPAQEETSEVVHEEAPVVNEAPEAPTTQNEALKPEDEQLFKNILISDGSLASRLMLTKLDSLIGSFGFNERFQCAEELFKGSNDDFNQALRVLDNMENFEEAKKQLVFYIHLYKWDLDSEAAIDFIRKVERRFS